MREVDKEEFYRFMGPKNVHPSITTRFPFTADWKLLDGFQKLLGRTVDRKEGGRIITTYYLMDGA